LPLSSVTQSPKMTECEDDYEALPSHASISAILVAGMFAGVLEHCTMYPIDTVKTQMQNHGGRGMAMHRNVLAALQSLGRRSYRGFWVVPIGAAPAHALYFGVYETLKRRLKEQPRVRWSDDIVTAIAGVGATLGHDAVMNPIEVIKQRMQMIRSPYRNSVECMRQVYKAEGVRAFYRSFPTQITMNIPFQVIHLVSYENCQDVVNPERKYSPMSHVVSGGLAGGLAAGLTTPLDNVKTMLNTQHHLHLAGYTTGTALENSFSAVRYIHSQSGALGFYRGLQARIMFQMPATAICWSVYEFGKYALSSGSESSIKDVDTVSKTVQHCST